MAQSTPNNPLVGLLALLNGAGGLAFVREESSDDIGIYQIVPGSNPDAPMPKLGTVMRVHLQAVAQEILKGCAA